MISFFLLLPLLVLIFVMLFEIKKRFWVKIHHKPYNKANQTHQTDIMPMLRDKSTLWIAQSIGNLAPSLPKKRVFFET